MTEQANPTASAPFPFRAEVGAYSSVLGLSVHLLGGANKMVGQIAFLCQDDALRGRATQERLAQVITDAVNGRSLPQAVAQADFEAPVLSQLDPMSGRQEPRPASEWHQDLGDCLWWCWRDGSWLSEAPYVGGPTDLGYTVECHTHAQNGETPAARFMVGGWPGYHTHFTLLPDAPPPPAALTAEAG